MNAPTTIILIGIFFCAVGTSYSAPNDFYSSNSETPLTIQNNRITFKTKQVSLDRFMQELAGKTSIVVTAYEPLNDTVGVDFDNMPMEKGLKWILRDYNNVFIYEPAKKGEPRITKIIIFSRSAQRSGTSQMPGKPNMAQAENQNPPRTQKGQSDLTRIEEQGKYAHYESKNGPAIARISKDLTKGNRDDHKLRAIQDLSSLNDEMAFVPLMQALYDENPKVSQDAMVALGKLDKENVSRALKGFLSDKDPRVRKITEETLKAMKK